MGLAARYPAPDGCCMEGAALELGCTMAAILWLTMSTVCRCVDVTLDCPGDSMTTTCVLVTVDVTGCIVRLSWVTEVGAGTVVVMMLGTDSGAAVTVLVEIGTRELDSLVEVDVVEVVAWLEVLSPEVVLPGTTTAVLFVPVDEAGGDRIVEIVVVKGCVIEPLLRVVVKVDTTVVVCVTELTGRVMLAVGSSVTVEDGTVVDVLVVGRIVDVILDVVAIVEVALGATMVEETLVGTTVVALGGSDVEVKLAEGSAPVVVAVGRTVAFVPEGPAEVPLVLFVLLAEQSIVRAGAAAWKAIAPFW